MKMFRQFRILANYGFGWEEIDSADDELSANNLLEQYMDDEPYAEFRIETCMDAEDDNED